MEISDKFLVHSEEDLIGLSRVLKNKKLSGTSEIIDEYQYKLSNYFNSKYALALSSGTAAIQVALFSLGIKRGDEVILAPTCPLMTVFPIIEIGAIPIFCDTNTNDFGANISSIDSKISKKTKAVIEVPMWGYPTPISSLSSYLKTKNIPLIADLAQAHGTKLNNKYLSEYADIACFSTHDRKLLSTGEGGFVLTENEELYNKMNSYIQFGFMNGSQFGLNFKLSSLQASIGLTRIGFIGKQISERTQNATYITDRINNQNVKEFPITENSNANYYSLLLHLSFSNNANVIKILNDKGIPSDIFRYNYQLVFYYDYLSDYISECPNAHKISKSITTIPVHSGLNKCQLDYIINELNKLK